MPEASGGHHGTASAATRHSCSGGVFAGNSESV